MDLKKQEFVIFDVETTGLSPAGGDRIIEIAALKVKNLKVQDKFCSFVDPQRDIPFGATQVNGITPEMVSGAPVSEEVLGNFLAFLGNGALVGHNIKFDLGFLCYEISSFGSWLKDGVVVIDTLKMARTLLPSLGRYPLWAVAKALGIEREQKHRAMDDVELTFDVFYRFMKSLGERDIAQVGILDNALDEFKSLKPKNKEKETQELFKW